MINPETGTPYPDADVWSDKATKVEKDKAIYNKWRSIILGKELNEFSRESFNEARANLQSEALRDQEIERKKSFWQRIKDFAGISEKNPPRLALENRSPYDPQLERNMRDPRYGMINHTTPEGFTYPVRLKEGYWDEVRKYYGQPVLPEGYFATQAGPYEEVERTPRLIYPQDPPYGIVAPTGERGFGAPLFVNGMAPLRKFEKNPVLTKRIVGYTPTSPAEKAQRLNTGFQLIGDPYSPYMEKRTQLGGAIPYADGYRAGGAIPESPYYDYRGFAPEYMNNPEFRGAVNKYTVDGLSRFGKLAGGAMIVGHALKEGPMDALVTATLGPIHRMPPESEYGSQAYRDMVASRKAEEDRQVLRTLERQKFYEENADSINATRRLYLGK